MIYHPIRTGTELIAIQAIPINVDWGTPHGVIQTRTIKRMQEMDIYPDEDFQVMYSEHMTEAEAETLVAMGVCPLVLIDFV